MNSKNKAFLEKICVEESSNLIGLENFGATGFSIIAWFWGGTPTVSQKVTKAPPIRGPPSDFYILPMKALYSPIIT